MKTTNSSTNRKHQSKNGPNKRDKVKVIEEYFDWNIQLKKPATQNGLKQFCLDMAKEIERDESITSISMYCRKKGVNRRTWLRWHTTFDFAAAAHDYCLEVIADRNQKKVQDDYRYIHFVQPYYDEIVYGSMAKYWAKLKQVEDNSNEPKHIILDCLKDCCSHKKEAHDDKPIATTK